MADGGGLKAGGADCWRTNGFRLAVPKPFRTGRCSTSIASSEDSCAAMANNGVSSTTDVSISTVDAKLLVLEIGVIPV